MTATTGFAKEYPCKKVSPLIHSGSVELRQVNLAWCCGIIGSREGGILQRDGHPVPSRTQASKDVRKCPAPSMALLQVCNAMIVSKDGCVLVLM
jgi:hypothetical protein